MFNKYKAIAIFSCDYGNQNEGYFFEEIGIFKSELLAKIACDNFEMSENAPNFCNTMIEEISFFNPIE